MKHYFKYIAVVIVILVLSLFPTWNFDEITKVHIDHNPLWNEEIRPINSPLTKALKKEGFHFVTGRGAEADPDGICYGDFGSDEYWVIQYNPEKQEVEAYAWIIGINWIGHRTSKQRFDRIQKILQTHLN